MDARDKLMINKLYDQVQRDCVNNDWEKDFILDMKLALDVDRPLSDRQRSKLEDVFEKN